MRQRNYQSVLHLDIFGTNTFLVYTCEGLTINFYASHALIISQSMLNSSHVFIVKVPFVNWLASWSLLRACFGIANSHLRLRKFSWSNLRKPCLKFKLNCFCLLRFSKTHFRIHFRYKSTFLFCLMLLFKPVPSASFLIWSRIPRHVSSRFF